MFYYCKAKEIIKIISTIDPIYPNEYNFSTKGGGGIAESFDENKFIQVKIVLLLQSKGDYKNNFHDQSNPNKYNFSTKGGGGRIAEFFDENKFIQMKIVLLLQSKGDYSSIIY